MKSAPRTMAPNTSDVPRSGWMSTSASIGSAMSPAPKTVRAWPIEASRVAR